MGTNFGVELAQRHFFFFGGGIRKHAEQSQFLEPAHCVRKKDICNNEQEKTTGKKRHIPGFQHPASIA